MTSRAAHRRYGYDEAGNALGVTAHTVRAWPPWNPQAGMFPDAADTCGMLVREA